MKTKQIEVLVQDNEKEAIKWLESEYPRGVDLVYIDYRDCFEDMAQLQQVLKGEDDMDWEMDSRWQSEDEILKNYKSENDIEEVEDEVREAMQEWLREHDTSEPVRDLLKNTGNKLFYIETEDYSEEDKGNVKELIKKYGKTEDQKKEIQSVLNEQFYGSPVSFYFYADVVDVFNAINKCQKKYIHIQGAYFSTIDRVQGSNWLGDNAVFDLVVPRDEFIENVYLDGAKGNGYGWGSIAGQTGYDEASVSATDTKKRGSLLITSKTSEEQAREARLQANWDKNKTCITGDMNWNRHTGKKTYSNDYPCGNKCEDCGTFWID